MCKSSVTRERAREFFVTETQQCCVLTRKKSFSVRVIRIVMVRVQFCLLARMIITIECRMSESVWLGRFTRTEPCRALFPMETKLEIKYKHKMWLNCNFQAFSLPLERVIVTDKTLIFRNVISKKKTWAIMLKSKLFFPPYFFLSSIHHKIRATTQTDMNGWLFLELSHLSSWQISFIIATQHICHLHEYLIVSSLRCSSSMFSIIVICL